MTVALKHPTVHQPASAWSEEQTLHVAACTSNPFRWRARTELSTDFRHHMNASANVVLHMGELAYGDRPFDVTNPEIYPLDRQWRTDHELFHKENILNCIIRDFPRDWKYGAIIDADFHFTRHDWALEAIHQLQMYDWVQLFSTYMDLSGETLGTGHTPLQTSRSFAKTYHDNGGKLPPGWGNGFAAPAAVYDEKAGVTTLGQSVGATGGAWSFTREAFDAVGGLMDKGILGHADWFMAFGLVSERAPDMHDDSYTVGYRDYIKAWQRRAARCGKNIGYIDCHAIHHFHGPKGLRGYSSRDKILVEHAYDPLHDVFYDWQGILQLTPDKPDFRAALRRYFVSRSEDLPQLPPLKH